MKKIVAILAMGLLAGCVSVDSASRPAQETVRHQSLVRAVKMDYHPEEGEVFVHDGRNLTVVQTFKNGEKVDGVMLYEVLAANTNESAFTRANFEIISTYRYCNSEHLRPGLYKYEGTDSYTTKDDRINTVRVFAERPMDSKDSTQEPGK